MRASLILLFALLPGLACGADAFSLTQKLYDDGLPHMALSRVVRLQPANPDAEDWIRWESLRLSLLSQLRQPAELLERVPLAPQNAPKDFLQKLYGHAAWAHLERQQGAGARIYLARLLWDFSLSSADQQWARRLVIRSYLVDHQPDEAYRAMLRHQQDFAPLSKEVATEFVQGLLAEGHATEAMTWLVDLDSASPAALRLQLKSGLVEPAAAMVQAQAVMQARPAQANDYLDVLADAAEMTGDAKVRIITLEQRLALTATPEEAARKLWETYASTGETVGAREQLLEGETESWLIAAADLAKDSSREARALYAYIATRYAGTEYHDLALTRLFASLAQDNAEAAVRLFAAEPWAEKKSPPENLYRMVDGMESGMSGLEMRALWLATGRHAAAQKRFDLAADYCVQAVLASDLREPDALANDAYKRALINLDRAGFKEEAVALQRRVAASRDAAKKQSSVKPAKSKTKK